MCYSPNFLFYPRIWLKVFICNIEERRFYLSKHEHLDDGSLESGGGRGRLQEQKKMFSRITTLNQHGRITLLGTHI